MDWFDKHMEEVTGSENLQPVNSWSSIVEIADEALSEGEDMVRLVEEEFFFQKWFADFLGVGESTVAGWMKSAYFPDYAKRAAVAGYYAKKYYSQLRKAKRDATRPKVVKDGDSYAIVQIKVDEVGVSLGEVMARDIPTKNVALKFASSVRAWELLSKTKDMYDDELSINDDDDRSVDYLREHRDEIELELARAFGHDNLLESKRQELESMRKIDEKAKSLLGLDQSSGADGPAEDGENADV